MPKRSFAFVPTNEAPSGANAQNLTAIHAHTQFSRTPLRGEQATVAGRVPEQAGGRRP
ncbi:hypothetical protein BURKHO8Y_210269 [Burkholderia sp. 8Y]|nr:hypothetical protein BURKHO8Y_210269 [Burkholderia sp. 8Y]